MPERDGLDVDERCILALAARFGYDFIERHRPEIRALLEAELADYIGDSGDRIEQVKYGINMDADCMDTVWLESMENGLRETDPCPRHAGPSGTSWNGIQPMPRWKLV